MTNINFNFINRLVPAVFQGDSVTRNRAIILIAVVGFNSIICLLTLPYIAFGLSGIDDNSRRVGYYLILFTISSYLLALIPYYIFNRLNIAGHVVTFGLFVGALVGMMITGGYTDSPVPVLLAMAPVFAFLLMGLAPGISWSIMAIGALVAMWLLEQANLIEPVQMLTDIAIKSLALALPVTIAVMVVGAMLIYEIITINLRTELQREKNKFKWDASHDSLTGLPNRPEFYHRLELGMRHAEVNHQSLALVCLDLDGFKPINDELGHHAGDEVLKIISKRMQAMLRGSDTVARLGGDEFAIILQGMNTDEELLKKLLAKFLKTISEEIIVDGKAVSVSASMGVAYYAQDDRDLNALCRKADQAMYKAKEVKNAWCLYGKM